MIYRAGKPTPSNLRPRPADQGKLSFRDSLSNPWPLPAGQRPVFRAGDDYIGIDASRLPRGSVIRDNTPEGHVAVQDVAAEALQDAVTERGRFPG